MKKYNIPNELAPNITRQKKKGALVYLFHRYQSGATGKSQIQVYVYTIRNAQKLNFFDTSINWCIKY